MARPRIKDVARRAGVSEKTVSNVINDYVHVSERTRQTVREAIAELGYRVNLAGRHLRQGRTGIIALVVPELEIPYFAELATHLIREAEHRSLTVLVHETRASRERELAALDGFGSNFVDGVILSALALTTGDIRDRDGTLPTVLLGERLQEGADHVAIDSEAAAREATEHLLALGRRHLLVIGGQLDPGPGTAQSRTRGHRAALEAAGLPFDPARVLPVAQFRTPDGAEAVRRALADGVRPDGLLCLNDQMALGALRALHERGLRVPEEVAVVGFDDVEGGQYSVPSLTTVSPDKPALARVAIDLLQHRIEHRTEGAAPGATATGATATGGASDGGPVGGPSGGAGEGVPQDRVVPHRLVVRESTAPSRRPSA